jgi:hypothetical protein
MVELSDFQKRFLLGGTGQTLYTQKEFDESLAQAKAIAIETSRKAVMIERQACAEVVSKLADMEDEGELCTALRNASEAILNRIPSQRN